MNIGGDYAAAFTERARMRRRKSKKYCKVFKQPCTILANVDNLAAVIRYHCH